MKEQISRSEYYPDADELDEYLRWQQASRVASETIDDIETALTLGLAEHQTPLYDQIAAETVSTPESDEYPLQRSARARGFFALNAVAAGEIQRLHFDTIPYEEALKAGPQSIDQAA